MIRFARVLLYESCAKRTYQSYQVKENWLKSLFRQRYWLPACRLKKKTNIGSELWYTIQLRFCIRIKGWPLYEIIFSSLRNLLSLVMGRKAVGLFVLLSLACLLTQIQGASYIPQFIKGTPQEGNVVATAPPDLRGQPLFKIDHKVKKISHFLSKKTVARAMWPVLFILTAGFEWWRW